MPQDLRLFRPAIVRRRAALAALAAGLLIPARRARADPMLLRIGGTGMALATMRQIGDLFVATNADVEIRILPSLGTSGGLAAVAAGPIDLALSARDLADADRTKGLQGFAYARTPIAFVTHTDVGMQEISLDGVARILAGQTTAWPNSTPVRLIRREPSDADWTMLRGVSAAMADAVRIALARPGLLTVATDQDNADSIERLPGSFGAMTIGQINAEARRVKPLVLDRVPPTVEALAAGRYPLSRTLTIVWREQHRQHVARFLAALRGPEASALLMRLGHIPLAGPGA
ncbi:MAG: substrate-binding domain-containing protein [Acetobacteraceae bacterium]